MTDQANAAKVEQLLADRSPEMRAVHERLHALVHELLPDAVEQSDLPDRLLAFGRGDRLHDQVVALIAHTAHVNVQLPDGVDLEDPDGLVEGTGKRVRHVKVRTVEDADRPALGHLIEQQVSLRS